MARAIRQKHLLDRLTAAGAYADTFVSGAGTWRDATLSAARVRPTRVSPGTAMIGVMGTMTPAARMAAILAILQNAPDHVLPSSALWAVSLDYRAGEPSGRRQYRRDLHALVARGLIATDISNHRTPQRTGVRLLFIGKDTDWELTAEEHAALRAARERHPRPFPGTTDGRDNRGTDLDLAMDAVRVLEEGREWMMIADLAAELRQPAERVVRALRELLSVDANTTRSTAGCWTSASSTK